MITLYTAQQKWHLAAQASEKRNLGAVYFQSILWYGAIIIQIEFQNRW